MSLISIVDNFDDNSGRNGEITLEESISLSSIRKLFGYAIEFGEPLFDVTKEYGVCNVIIPLLNLRRYFVIPEARILGKKPDILAISPEYIVGRRYFYAPIFTPIVIIEAKARPLNGKDLRQLGEYANIFGHVFLATNKYCLKLTNRNYLNELIKFYNKGTLSFILVDFSNNEPDDKKLHVKYVINSTSIRNIRLCSEKLENEIRSDLMKTIEKVRGRGINVDKLRKEFFREMRRKSLYEQIPILYADSVEKVINRSKLSLILSGRIQNLYERGESLPLSALTFTSVFIVSVASSSTKLPYLFLFHEQYSKQCESTIEEVLISHE